MDRNPQNYRCKGIRKDGKQCTRELPGDFNCPQHQKRQENPSSTYEVVPMPGIDPNMKDAPKSYQRSQERSSSRKSPDKPQLSPKGMIKKVENPPTRKPYVPQPKVPLSESAPQPDHIARIKSIPRNPDGPAIRTAAGWEVIKPDRGKGKDERKELRDKCGDGCFLRPKDNGFPICPKLSETKGECYVDCRGLAAAKNHQRFLNEEWGKTTIGELQDHFGCKSAAEFRNVPGTIADPKLPLNPILVVRNKEKNELYYGDGSSKGYVLECCGGIRPNNLRLVKGEVYTFTFKNAQDGIEHPIYIGTSAKGGPEPRERATRVLPKFKKGDDTQLVVDTKELQSDGFYHLLCSEHPWMGIPIQLIDDGGPKKKKLTNWQNFSKIRRAQIKNANPGMKGAEVSRMISAEWSKMNDAEKRTYDDK